MATGSDASATPPSSPLAKAFSVVVFALLLVAAAAMFLSNHIPSPLGTRIALVVAFAFAIVAGWQSLDGNFYSSANPRMIRATSNWLLRSVWRRVPLMALFVFLVTFSGIREGLMAAATAAIGSSATRTVTITGVGYSSRSCDHYNIAEAWFLLDHALCASREDLAAARPGDHLLLEGKASRFGINVERHSLIPAARDTPAS